MGLIISTVFLQKKILKKQNECLRFRVSISRENKYKLVCAHLNFCVLSSVYSILKTHWLIYQIGGYIDSLQTPKVIEGQPVKQAKKSMSTDLQKSGLHIGAKGDKLNQIKEETKGNSE